MIRPPFGAWFSRPPLRKCLYRRSPPSRERTETPVTTGPTARHDPRCRAAFTTRHRRGCFLHYRSAVWPEQGAATMTERSTFAQRVRDDVATGLGLAIQPTGCLPVPESCQQPGRMAPLSARRRTACADAHLVEAAERVGSIIAAAMVPASHRVT